MASTDPAKYQLNHTMIRVKEPQRSIRYYEYLGMKLYHQMKVPDAKFDVYFMVYDSPTAPSHGKKWTQRQGVLELTHNYGSEDDSNFKVNNGNGEPHRGFGHICVSVDNLQAACKRIEEAGYKFQKRLADGRSRNLAFALDPDDYCKNLKGVEIISYNDVNGTQDIQETDPSNYRFNHSMIRVKDAETSIKFYRDKMGMNLLRTSENEAAGFNLYFLGYEGDNGSIHTTHPTAGREGILELTWNYGTEKQADFKYHNGNDEPQGFGHICVTVDDIQAACQRWEEMGVKFQKNLTEGRMKNIAFLLDPDGYWVEILQQGDF